MTAPDTPGSSDWERSAAAWLAHLGRDGDFGRRYVLDPLLRERALRPGTANVLDVGCGEGRFCRMLGAAGVATVGVDPTPALLSAARARDADGRYVRGVAEALPFADAQFDLVTSYLSLIDMPQLAPAIAQMARVLRPGGRLLLANLQSFHTAGADRGPWRRALDAVLHVAVGRYLDERAMWIAFRGIRVRNHHRPLERYVQLLLAQGLELVFFAEPAPQPGAPAARAARYRRQPWFVVMEWHKPGPTRAAAT